MPYSDDEFEYWEEPMSVKWLFLLIFLELMFCGVIPLIVISLL